MMNTDTRQEIETALRAFSDGDLRASSIDLLSTLGYQSEKQIDLEGSPETFLERFDTNPDRLFNKEKALFGDWKEIHILFQLTDQELSNQHSLFTESGVKQELMNSYLFFALKLEGESSPRGKLAQITRQLNRLFPMPVMVIFEYNATLSIAVINRRRSKRDADKDVLGKVTLIQEISLSSPHRGHLDILGSFSLPALAGKTGIHSFDALHAAWEEIFNVELLNKKFYRELSNWYFWAMQHVHFPFDNMEIEIDKTSLFKNEEKVREHDAKNLIRLLTRLLFVWFIKEKGLIPASLFEIERLEKDLLKDFDAQCDDTRFYKAILQNLFFATLNQTCGKRQFRNQGRQHRNITTLMRYEQYFLAPDAFIEMLESVVPFMNGGLFECLDMPHPTRKGPQGGDVILYEDGFSDRDDNVLKMPDYLFFGKEQTIDLSGIYGDKKRKKEKVRGIIHILNSYKFTIVENTPIEQEIALDPELLGKVFENLLASYNPETKTTARKQTGSFYTPRTIVDYMVDESLKVYLKKALCESCVEVTEEDANVGLNILFAYTEKEHAFSDPEKHALIAAIDNCKILDPACGSGAFPMGILHKLEFILGKLDKNNQLWRDRQTGKVDNTITVAEQIDDATIRENTIKDLESQKQDIEEAFDQNDLGYGRKLYLIENCIYGVDIQSIATQVSKLRFFISLIVDQKSDPKKDNFGIRPLPNLETKFTSANTLIQIEKPAAQGKLFESDKVKDLEKELKRIRHSLFNAKTPKTKRKYRLRDKELRDQIAVELEANGWGSASARQLSEWDPYDQNASSPFFDPEWMYGIINGFDIVIGNPPYRGFRDMDKSLKLSIKIHSETAHGKFDLYVPFVERGVKLLREKGLLSFIMPTAFLKRDYGEALRSFILNSLEILKFIDFGHSQIFSGATNYTGIFQLQRIPPREKHRFPYIFGNLDSEPIVIEQSRLTSDPWILLSKRDQKILDSLFLKGQRLGEIASISEGVVTGLNEFYLVSHASEFDISDPVFKPCLRGSEIRRYSHAIPNEYLFYPYTYDQHGTHLIGENKFASRCPDFYAFLKQKKERIYSRGYFSKSSKEWFELWNQRKAENFESLKVVTPELADRSRFALAEKGVYYGDTVCGIIPLDSSEFSPYYLVAALNSSVVSWYFKTVTVPKANGFFIYKVMFLKDIPIPKPSNMQMILFRALVALIECAKNANYSAESQYLEELIDACVMECYFSGYMEENDLLFHADTITYLANFDPTVSEAKLKEFLANFYQTTNAVGHPIRNRLMRISIDSPDLLRIIKEEGKV